MTTRSTARRKAPAADFPVPQTREAAAAAIAEIGTLRRQLAARLAAANDQIARITAAVEDALTPVRAELEALEKGVQVYAEAHREELTGSKVKHHDFATGRVLWRLRPPSVSIRGVGEVIARLKALGLARFLREKVEPDKEAMLKEPAIAGGVAGVSIVSGVEDFVIEPIEAVDGGAS